MHGVLLHRPGERRHAPRQRAALGRRRRPEPEPDVRHAPRARLARRGRDLARWAPTPAGGESRCPARGASQIAKPVRVHARLQGRWTSEDIREVQALRRRRQAGAQRRLRHPRHLRARTEALLHQVLAAVLQPPHRRVRRVAREPRPLHARGARAGPRGGGRRLRRSRCASRSTRLDRARRPRSRGIRQEGEGLQFVQLVDHLVDLWDINVGNAGVGRGRGAVAHPSREPRAP